MPQQLINFVKTHRSISTEPELTDDDITAPRPLLGYSAEEAGPARLLALSAVKSIANGSAKCSGKMPSWSLILCLAPFALVSTFFLSNFPTTNPLEFQLVKTLTDFVSFLNFSIAQLRGEENGKHLIHADIGAKASSCSRTPEIKMNLSGGCAEQGKNVERMQQEGQKGIVCRRWS